MGGRGGREETAQEGREGGNEDGISRMLALTQKSVFY